MGILVGVLFFILSACDTEFDQKKPTTKSTKLAEDSPRKPADKSTQPEEVSKKPADSSSLKGREELWVEPGEPAASAIPLPVDKLKVEDFEIALLHNNDSGQGEWRVTAIVNDGRTTLKETGFSDVNQMNRAIVEFIAEHDAAFESKMKGKTFTFSTLTSKLISVMQYRRCTVYLFLQTSPVGSRVIAYGSTLIKHHGTSFGTALNSVNISTVKQHLLKENHVLPKDVKYFL